MNIYTTNPADIDFAARVIFFCIGGLMMITLLDTFANVINKKRPKK